MNETQRCVVVGAGVAGLWTAWALADAGVQVTVLDASTAGGGASWGNAGWICPAQTGPLPEPGIVAHGFRDLMKRDSTLHFSPGALVRMGPWIARFARYCNKAAYDRGVLALSELGYPSFKLIERLGLDKYCDKTGLLVASKQRADVDHFLDKIAPLIELGQGRPGTVLIGDEVQDLEPVLPADYKAATLIANHWQVNPAAFTQGLIECVRAVGVDIVEDTLVRDFEVRGGGVKAVQTDDGPLSADHVVLAAGARTAILARVIGHPIPVVGGKGYSVDVLPSLMPRQAILTTDTHLALSPIGDKMRIAGGMEFTNSGTRISKPRLDAMKRSAASVVGSWTAESKPWAGLRPVAPDGMPLIGRLAPTLNVSVATGYSMLGMTISPAAGKFLADAIITGNDGTIGPFSPQRFKRRR